MVKRRNEVMMIRVKEKQKQLYQKASDKEEMFLSEWVRRTLDNEAKKILKEK